LGSAWAGLGVLRAQNLIARDCTTRSSLADLYKVCVTFFGKPRQSGSSHAVFKTPWPGDPRVNIQNDKGKAKPYQVRQVLLAVNKMADTKTMEKPQ
jgi:hypothetical protein